MRFAVPQLLVGTIVGDSSGFIAINTIEPYGHYILADTHHGCRFTPELSTFPTKEASRACDLLIVSSQRLDHESVNLGAHATLFEPSSRTRIFLDKQSVQRAHDLFKKNNIEEVSAMPCLYQLKQVRSKFDKLSIYNTSSK
ncbi:hypothetical protein BCV72DRAFT_222391 [Rhizopus microsporus var. microsporus]|uniref:Uncharacterized protein n=1 Tax=Rhizopus microsporus var. microsporus TaxID=86635 RepID=A0A1X0RCV8_RHIZD|nr:hypothetical protein BCV72DRAFT_222391 [Rhizopus microsporus var. microsporus]